LILEPDLEEGYLNVYATAVVETAE
jgi:hypothetical protein